MASPVSDSYAAASGQQITAGRFVLGGNKRIAIWGQSNAIGRADRADISASPLSSDAGLATYDAGTFSRVYIWTGSAFAQLTPASNNGCSAGQFGPEFGLAVRWMRETSSGNLYLEKEAFSGVSITYFEPYVWPATGMFSRHSSATTWLTNNGITAQDAGWLWIQGESDYTQAQSWYQTRLEALIQARTDSGLQTAATKRVLVQMASGSSQYGANVAAAKSAIAAASPTNTMALSAPFYMKADNLHQNGRGQVQIGYDAFETIFGASHIAT